MSQCIQSIFFFHKGMIFVLNYSIRICLVEVFFFISNDNGGFFGLLLMSLFWKHYYYVYLLCMVKNKDLLNDYADQRPQIGRTRGCMEGSLPLVVSSVLQNNFPELCTAFCKVTLKRQFAALQVFNFLLSCDFLLR